MGSKNFIIILISILGSIHANAQDSVLYLSLKQVCQFGIQNNIDVRNAGLLEKKSYFKYKETNSKLYPQLEAYSTFNYNYSIPKMIVPGEIFGQSGLIPIEIGTKYDWSSGFKLTQILYNQSYFTSLKLNKLMCNIDNLSIKQKKEEIIYQITQLYNLCQAILQQKIQYKTIINNTDTLLKITKLRRENGIIRNVDYSMITVKKNNVQTQIDNLEQLYNQQMNLLKYIAGLNINIQVVLTDSLSVSLEKVTLDNPNFNNNTQLLVIEKKKEAIILTRQSNQESYLPTLSGFAQYYFQGQRNEFDYFKGGEDKFYNVGVVGVTLNLPIFDGFEKHNKTQQYEIELLQMNNIRTQTTDYITKEFSDACSQYKNSLNILSRQEENTKVAEENYLVSFQEYRQQIITLSDLMLSENGLTEARLSYINALLQLKNAELDLKKAKCELLNN